MLDVLAVHGVKMTIPVTADALHVHERKIARLADAGHEIAGHGDVHRGFLEPRQEQVRRLRSMSAAFEDRLGFRPTGFRAPYLLHNSETYSALAEAGLGYDSSRVFRDPGSYLRALIGGGYAHPVRWQHLPRIWVRHVIGRSLPRPRLVAPGVVEFPVFDLDDWFFIDSPDGPRLTSDQSGVIADHWLRALGRFRRGRELVFVVQAHPGRMNRGLLEAVDMFLEGARSWNAEFATLSEVRERLWADNRWRMRNGKPPDWIRATQAMGRRR